MGMIFGFLYCFSCYHLKLTASPVMCEIDFVTCYTVGDHGKDSMMMVFMTVIKLCVVT